MIKSMTGFGKAQAEINSNRVTVQIKSLNSKQLDFYLKAPSLYRDKELEIRGLVSDSADRGKIEMSVHVESVGMEGETEINKELFKAYYREIKSLVSELGEATDIISIISRFPEVLKSKDEELKDDEWKAVRKLIESSLHELNDFREQEGRKLEADFIKRVALIMNYLEKVAAMENERLEQFRSRIDKNLRAFIESEKINQDRFEQEMIYYLEKIDITEEKTRLFAHCDYFIKTLKEESLQGKKLGFISQEIGREINTIGSKANHAGMQKIVVQMKDELEKIKEQLLNVL